MTVAGSNTSDDWPAEVLFACEEKLYDVWMTMGEIGQNREGWLFMQRVCDRLYERIDAACGE